MTGKELEDLELRFKNRTIDILEFLELFPDEYVPNKEALIDIIKEKRNEADSN